MDATRGSVWQFSRPLTAAEDKRNADVGELLRADGRPLDLTADNLTFAFSLYNALEELDPILSVVVADQERWAALMPPDF